MLHLQVSVNSQTSPVDLKRLLREIRILRRLDHENIVRICHTLVSHKGDTSCVSISYCLMVNAFFIYCLTMIYVMFI